MEIIGRQRSIGFKKFGDMLNMELLLLWRQISPSSCLLWLLLGERGPPLEKPGLFQLELRLEHMTK